ncbi:alpha/beta fold hydrolase [Cytobacillus solani]|uniref:Lipase n=1 Tax=Cytobacillus solani TaxID=1637975 RepID=A0A0Q3RBC2_9BACI|nr:alpha/beta hydrolase [Cytobacillus solani]KOP78765.1 lipase [Bacillus sp. FJAT-21945]KQL27520.1 lipase [Cytobacillus solani]
MKRYFVNHGEMKVFITEWGNKEKPIIFCLHGLSGTALTFIEIAEKLKDEYRFISIDAPGHGQTTSFKSPDEYEMPNFISWLNELFKIINIDQFYFLSHSWGSFVSLFYLVNYPEKIKGTILIDGGYQTKRLKGQTMDEDAASYEKAFNEYVFVNWDEFINTEKKAYKRWSPLLEIAAKDRAVEKDGMIYLNIKGTTANSIVKAMHKHETEDIYQYLPPSIILLRATLPNSWNGYREKVVRTFIEKTNGLVKEIPNATHMLHWDSPEIVVEEIKTNWLN